MGIKVEDGLPVHGLFVAHPGACGKVVLADLFVEGQHEAVFAVVAERGTARDFGHVEGVARVLVLVEVVDPEVVGRDVEVGGLVVWVVDLVAVAVGYFQGVFGAFGDGEADEEGHEDDAEKHGGRRLVAFLGDGCGGFFFPRSEGGVTAQ